MAAELPRVVIEGDSEYIDAVLEAMSNTFEERLRRASYVDLVRSAVKVAIIKPGEFVGRVGVNTLSSLLDESKMVACQSFQRLKQSGVGWREKLSA